MAGLHAWYRFSVAARAGEAEPPRRARALACVALLRADARLAGLLERVEAEVATRAAYAPNDPQLPQQLASSYGAIGLTAAWDLTAGSPDVVVQVRAFSAVQV
jgi:hypothetical protein